jgi:ribonuclease R
LIPIGSLPDDYYIHDEDHHLLRGRHNRKEYKLGDTVEVILAEADPLTGSLICNILDNGKPSKGRKKPSHSRSTHRKRRKK